MRRKKPLTMQTYAVITRAVEEGVAYGLQRYYKYNYPVDTIDDNAIAAHIEREVLNALCEVIDFGDD